MSEQAKMSFLEKLDYLIKRDGITRHDVANGTGIPASTIHNWYWRNENNPKREHLVLIAKFFNVSLHYLCVDECTSTPFGLFVYSIVDTIVNVSKGAQSQ